MTRSSGSPGFGLAERQQPGRPGTDNAAARGLTVRLLGGVDVRLGDARLESFDAPRLASLLSYLLLHRYAPQPRTHLASLFWPDSTEAQARTNLRQLVHHLRRAIPGSERFFSVSTGTIQWQSEASYWLDVEEFERFVDVGLGRKSDEGLAALEEAARLYVGDLLPGMYDEWVLQRREALRRRHAELRRRLAEMFEARRDWEAALFHTEAVVRADPLHEASYRRLMRLHALRGDRPRALRVYEECALILERELGVEPEQATRAARDSLREVIDGGTSHRRLVAEWPLVGRRTAWETMVRCWQEAVAGQSLMLCVVGEPGIGKTRLVDELAAWCRAQGIVTAHSRSYAIEGGLAYAPVVEWLRSDALRSRLADLDDVWKAELSRLLPELGLPDALRARPQPVSGSERRQRLFQALARAFLAAGDPLLLVLDDLPWTDRDTLAFLHYLLRSEPRGRILLAGTARTEELTRGSPPGSLLEALGAADRLVELKLDPLDIVDTSALCSVVGNTDLSKDALNELYAETEGNPLFVVEWIRAGQWLQAGGDRALDDEPAPLPPRLRTFIEARLGRLPSTDVIEVAAAVGRPFSPELILRASRLDASILARGLDELRRRSIIKATGIDQYDFSHDRIRDVAYEMVGPERRRQIHRNLADALARSRGSDLTAMSGVIASHYERATEWDQAISFHVAAAEAAQMVYANEEAIASLNRGLGLVERLPPGRERDERELRLLMAIGVPMVITEGYAPPEVYDLYTRARQLCNRLGRAPDPPILRALAIASVARCELDEARQLGEELGSVASRLGDELLRVESEYVLGVTEFWSGDFATARRHFEAATRADLEDARDHLGKFAQDPKVVCLSRLAHTFWYLGLPTQAVTTAKRALALGESRGHPFSLAYALWFGVRLAYELGDEPWIEQLLATAKTLTGERRLSFRHEPLGVVFDGWLRLRRGEPGAVDQIRSAATGSLPIDQVMHASLVLKVLAEAYLLVGDAASALDIVRQAMRSSQATGQRYQESELHRIEAVALMAIGASAAEIEASLARALDVSRAQSAPALELRAANTLARWRQQADAKQRESARDALAAVFCRFTEGHETPDLLEAKELLGRLG